MAFCREGPLTFILQRSTFKELISTIILTRGFSSQIPSGIPRGSKVSTKQTWRMGSRILFMWSLQFSRTELRWTPIFKSEPKERKSTWITTCTIRGSPQCTPEINSTLQTQATCLRWVQGLTIIRSRKVLGKIFPETGEMLARREWGRIRLLRRTWSKMKVLSRETSTSISRRKREGIIKKKSEGNLRRKS